MRMRMSMPMTKWPDADRMMVEALRRKGGLFDDDGGLADLRASSMTILTQSWGRFLEWLRLNEPAALAEPPIGRATLPRLRAWLEAEDDLRPPAG